MDEETQRAVADLLAITERHEIENNTRYQDYGRSLANETVLHFTPRLPGHPQLHGVLSHSSTRPSDLHGMQPVSDPAVNSSSMTDGACLWHYAIDVLNANSSDIITACIVCVNKKTKHDIYSLVYYLTQHSMHDNIIKSSIAGKVSQKTRQTNVSTAKNTETHAIMSTEPTHDTL